MTKTLKSTSCKGLPEDQSNSLRIGSSRHEAHTPLPPAHRKRTCFSLRSDTENVCCEGEDVIMAAGCWASLNTTNYAFVVFVFFFFTSTCRLSTSTTWTLFQYPTHSRLPFARQQRMGWTGFDPRGMEWYDCRFQPPDDHRTKARFTPTQANTMACDRCKIETYEESRSESLPELCEKIAKVPSAKPAMTQHWV